MVEARGDETFLQSHPTQTNLPTRLPEQHQSYQSCSSCHGWAAEHGRYIQTERLIAMHLAVWTCLVRRSRAFRCFVFPLAHLLVAISTQEPFLRGNHTRTISTSPARTQYNVGVVCCVMAGLCRSRADCSAQSNSAWLESRRVAVAAYPFC